MSSETAEFGGKSWQIDYGDAHFIPFAGGALDTHAFVQCHCKKFHDSVSTLKEALALYRRALPIHNPIILRTVTNLDSVFGHIVSHHVDAGDYRSALGAANTSLLFLKENLPSNHVMVSPPILLVIIARLLCADR